jgi:hypothetical protein
MKYSCSAYSVVACHMAPPVTPCARTMQALAWLLSVPGASNTVLEASVPYSRGSLVDILGSEPSQYCCQETAVEMAKAAYKRAANLTPLGTPVVGISATCSLATDKPKRGEHHAHIAAHTGLTTHLLDITLSKGSRSRWGEDVVVSKLILQATATAFDVQLQADELDLGLVASNATADQQQQQQAAAPTTPFQLAPAGEEEQTFASLPRASASVPAAAPAGEEEPAAEAASSRKPGLPPPSPPRYSQAMARPTVSGGGLAAGDKLLVQERPLGEPLEALLAGQVGGRWQVAGGWQDAQAVARAGAVACRAVVCAGSWLAGCADMHVLWMEAAKGHQGSGSKMAWQQQVPYTEQCRHVPAGAASCCDACTLPPPHMTRAGQWQ